MRKYREMTPAQRHELAKEMLRHGFVRHGSFVAMPLRFPNVSTGIPPASCHITNLCPALPGHSWFFGTTAGETSHLFLAAPRAPYGYVLDLGAVPALDRIEGLAIMGTHPFWELVAVAGNCDGRGVVFFTKAAFPKDGIQEWGFRRCPFEEIARIESGPIHDIAALPGTREHNRIVCLSDRGTVELDLDSGSQRQHTGSGFPGIGMRKLLSSGGRLFVVDSRGTFWESPATAGSTELRRTRLRLHVAVPAAAVWATDGNRGVIVGGGQGRLFHADLGTETVIELPKAPLAPVKCLAALPDGRLYGFCGDGIGRLFGWDGKAAETQDLGAVAAVQGARRYAYDFSCALVGDDGEIHFGEYDRDGHVWTYFPPRL